MENNETVTVGAIDGEQWQSPDPSLKLKRWQVPVWLEIHAETAGEAKLIAVSAVRVQNRDAIRQWDVGEPEQE